jgi:BMFP domain-containing protein YqiC
MSEELRPCPFCGGKAVTSTFFDWDDLEYMAFEVNDSESIDGEVTCENERCINGWYLSPKAWNTRPIEDALNARIAELEAEQRWHVVKECNDVATPIDVALRKRIAELNGVIEILEDQQREVKNILIDKNLHIDSLYEEGYKLQQRIAELEAAQRWIPVSEPPKVSGKYLLLNIYDDVYPCDFIAGTEIWVLPDYDTITHWMPLPKLPEVQE